MFRPMPLAWKLKNNRASDFKSGNNKKRCNNPKILTTKITSGKKQRGGMSELNGFVNATCFSQAPETSL